MPNQSSRRRHHFTFELPLPLRLPTNALQWPLHLPRSFQIGPVHADLQDAQDAQDQKKPVVEQPHPSLVGQLFLMSSATISAYVIPRFWSLGNSKNHRWHCLHHPMDCSLLSSHRERRRINLTAYILVHQLLVCLSPKTQRTFNHHTIICRFL